MPPISGLLRAVEDDLDGFAVIARSAATKQSSKHVQRLLQKGKRGIASPTLAMTREISRAGSSLRGAERSGTMEGPVGGWGGALTALLVIAWSGV
ncbi:MAG: hypothetical protein LBU47_02375, partial [Christensenellaceae bacterium]|nr:hypothetical protein [Christensenellaceae bacterium]